MAGGGMRMWPVLIAVMMTATSCGLGPAPGEPVCVAHADNPHRSATQERKGIATIVGKGWFTCGRAPQHVTLTVQLQQAQAGQWLDVQGVDARRQESVAGPRTDRKYEVWAATPCASGTFRTAAVIEGTDDAGQAKRSPWVYGRGVTDPC
jgi:hypothetical protein